jgi:lipoprotein-anchoring transpeptidase ErfK/SrfK
LAVLVIGGSGAGVAQAVPASTSAGSTYAGSAFIRRAITVTQSLAAAPQALVVLLGDHVARRAPSADGGRIEGVAARRPLTRGRTVLPVLGRGGPGEAWLRVRLPGRPNGHTGWISAGRTRPATTPWRIVVSLAARRAIVFREGREVRRFAAIVGKASTPTPRGNFFVEEALRLSPSAAGAPFALATSARSNVLQEFDGGPGQIALHGTDNLSGTLGTAASHGCVRLAPHAIAWLASRIGAGVPVSIRARYVAARPRPAPR